jgi:glycosyltransferase involved in cell wall biosynthesis
MNDRMKGHETEYEDGHEMNSRLLVISSDKYPPFRVDVSVLFGEELAARGFEIDWILQSDGECPREFQCRWGGGSVWVGRTDKGTSRFHRLHKHVLAFRHDLKVVKLAREFSYDFIQVKDKVLAAMPAIWAARRHGAAFVYWLSFPHPEASTYMARIGAARYPWLYRLRGWLLFRLLYRFILPRADHIFVQSEQMKSDLVGYGLPASRMTAVPMGVRIEEFRDIVDGTTKEVGHVATIGYLGTLASERRIDFLVRCLARVLSVRPEARLLLVGAGNDPGDEEQIRGEARRLGILDRIEITGFLPRKKALLRISEATVCVSPFYPTPILNSTSPTKLIEYMALERPVVANDHPEQRLVLKQSQAGLCVPYDESAFAAAILRLLNHPEEAEAMGKRGRKYAENHRDYGRIADAVAIEYRNISDLMANTQSANRSHRKTRAMDDRG